MFRRISTWFCGFHRRNINYDLIVSLPKVVLKCFKNLHKARKDVFRDDIEALQTARIKINMEYRKNKSVEDVDNIKQMLQLSREVEKELRTNVIQAKLVKPNVYEVRITPDTQKLNNIPFQDCKV